jgi:hypothetical protein
MDDPPKVIVIPEPGTVITFRLARRLFGWKRGTAQILGLESEHGIIHVRVLGAELIGHLPIAAPAFLRSGAKELRAGVVPQDSWKALAEWREQYSRGEAGAFGVSLAEAIDLVFQTVREGREPGDDPHVESAYPVRGADGVHNIVKAVCSTAASRERRGVP